MKLQITNIARDLSEEDFTKLFEKFGPLKECKLIFDAVTGKSKGFGFVVISNEMNAVNAQKTLHGRVVNGQRIKVKFCAPTPRKD